MHYAIGDIHGRLDLLEKLYGMILEDIARVNDHYDNEIIFLGDYTDRGPHGVGVLRFLMGLKDTPKLKHIFVQGNHEEMLITIYDEPNNTTMQQMWLGNGGDAIPRELGITDREYLTGKHLLPEVTWLKENLVPFHETIDYLFVHAGIPRDKQAETANPYILRWGRWEDVGYYANYPRMVIHGHVPTGFRHNGEAKGQPRVDANRINVDTGCPWTNTLTCVILPNVRADGPPRFLQAKIVPTIFRDKRATT